MAWNVSMIPNNCKKSITPLFEFDVVSTQTIAGQFSCSSGKSITVDWGDNTSNVYSGTDQSYTKDYGSAGNRTVKIYGDVGSLTKYTMAQTGANVRFDLSRLPAGLVYCACTGTNTVYGALSGTPSTMTYFSCTGNNTIDTYTSKVWADNQNRIYSTPVSPGGLSSAEIDQLLIDLAAAGGTWTGSRQIYLMGTHAPRTSASNSAVSTLAGKGVTVTTTS